MATGKSPPPARPPPLPTADLVPGYTRQYLRGLSMAVNTRVKALDDAVAYFPPALARTGRLRGWLVAALAALGLLWLAASVVVLVAIYRDDRAGAGAASSRY
ncbi:hypothetical protein SAMD00023353_8100160 [Rosellinia necatrix]|uniref:Uncharacterized protein n=1 Tax=Rosellinia necatrix TaxID=77044 RepID=A0A1W2TV88_ROSNE|nr:hypothetical protein SAMD00023353_8100160 [Rosellinia necatrix]